MTGTVVAYGLSFGLKILAKPPPAPAPAPADEPVKLRSCLKKPAKEPEPEPEPELEPEPVEPEPVEPTFLDFVITFLFKTPEQAVPVPVLVPVPVVKDFKIKATPTRVQIVSRWIIQREHCHNRSSEKRRWVYDGGDEDIIMHNGD